MRARSSAPLIRRRRVVPRPLLGAITAASVLAASSGRGISAPAVPFELRGAIVVRSVGYERGFAGRAGPAVLAVVGGASGESASDADAMAAVLARLVERTTVANRPVKVVRVIHASKESTLDALRTSKAEVVYVARGLSSIISEVPAREGELVRILFCGDGDDLQRGCTLAVARNGDKPELLLNKKQVNDVGLRFDPQLLRLARIVD